MTTVKNFPGVTWNNKVTIEYVMLKVRWQVHFCIADVVQGVNDSVADAKGLVALLKNFPAYVNLIPFNPWPGAPYECSSNNTIRNFASIVDEGGVKVVVRQTRGDDILGKFAPVALTASKRGFTSYSRPILVLRLSCGSKCVVVCWLEIITDTLLAACGQLKTLSQKAKKIIPDLRSNTPQLAVA